MITITRSLLTGKITIEGLTLAQFYGLAVAYGLVSHGDEVQECKDYGYEVPSIEAYRELNITLTGRAFDFKREDLTK